MHHRRTVDLVVQPEFTVSEFSCLDDHLGWFEGFHDCYEVYLIRDGMFRVRSGGKVSIVDRTVCYVGTVDTERSFAHPLSGERCTMITMTPRLWSSMAGDAPISGFHAYTDARMELAHRRILAAAPDPGYAVTEELFNLIAGVLAQTATGATPVGERLAGADQALVDRARGAIVADHPSARRLDSLADLLGVSQYRLSRAFPRQLGVSLTHYRNRVRITRALDRLAAGEPSLARLAADLGFADQAHLTRTVRDHLGHTPTVLRRMLTHQR
jgi:AraC-like DNA-binding protein